MKNISILVLLLLLFACGGKKSLIDEVELRNDESSHSKSLPKKGQLAHAVFLKTKPDLSEKERANLIFAIQEMEKMDVIRKLELGIIASTKDPRFISDHDLIFVVYFNSLEDYAIYKNHPLHIKLKNLAKNSLAKPPAVYDYWTH